MAEAIKVLAACLIIGAIWLSALLPAGVRAFVPFPECRDRTVAIWVPYAGRYFCFSGYDPSAPPPPEGQR